MGKKNKRYFKQGLLAVALLLISFFYYENKQKVMDELNKNSDSTETSEQVDSTIETSFTESEQLISTENETADTTEIIETSTSKEAAQTPQTIRAPMEVKGIVVVNKQYPLPESYDPGENKEAVTAFRKMNEEMRNLGLDISEEYSGYRSYDEQETLYESYVKSDGQKEADRYSSRPGYSEHQTGLAFDFINTTGALVNSKIEADWIAENAHKYGFIVRYKEGQEEITGYMAEAWHVRYVGTEVAKEIKEKNQTLEEYLGVKGGEYEEK